MSRPWYVLDRTEVERAINTSAQGLSNGEVRTRLEHWGPNQLEEIAPPGWFTVLLHQFRSPLIYILLIAVLVTLVLREFADAIVIAAVLALNALIGFVQERRAEASVRALMQHVTPRAHVIRGGREAEVESRELVPGDVVLLESGARVPADIRLFATARLLIDESLLTGESLPVAKRDTALEGQQIALAERANIAHMGTVVASGRGRGYAVETGARTALGSIAEHIRAAQAVETPLQARMARFARLIGIVVGLSAGAAFGLGVFFGEPATRMFTVAVALAVAAIPEGLPVVFTITLALGVRRMARRNAIIRYLPAVETLGSTTVIGSDKTGTLTVNRMVVQQVWTAGETFDLSKVEAESTLSRAEALGRTLAAGVLTNEAEIYRVNGGYELHGDPTEAALLVAAAQRGLDPQTLRQTHRVVGELPFEPERRYSASIRLLEDERTELFVKGAPERILESCTRQLGPMGIGPLDSEQIHGALRDMTARGLRVLAMAQRSLDLGPSSPESAVEQLVFLGLAGLMDPPRAGVKEAIAGCQDAGIRVVMITGDHADTAQAIARDLGISWGDGPVITGVELDRMDDRALETRAPEVSVYARVAPEHKLRIVRALRAIGETVAVTGDGVNDAPALKSADIGIAMGRSGTDVAREASDMVLADDNFVSIYAAVEEGRVTFDNLRKVTFFLVSTGAAAIAMILTALAIGWPLPMVAAQLLWLNLVTNGLQDVALAFEPGEPQVLQRPPRSRAEGVMSTLLWQRTVVAGLVMAAGTLFMFRWELAQSDSLTRAQTVALTTMVLFQVFHVGNARSETQSIFRRSPFSNPFLLIATAAALLVHIGSLYLGATQFLLRVEPLEAEAWARMVAVASSIVIAMELDKLWRTSGESLVPVRQRRAARDPV